MFRKLYQPQFFKPTLAALGLVGGSFCLSKRQYSPLVGQLALADDGSKTKYASIAAGSAALIVGGTIAYNYLTKEKDQSQLDEDKYFPNETGIYADIREMIAKEALYPKCLTKYIVH